MILQPQYCRNNIGLGSFAFARHYLRNHYYFLFLRLLRCFSSARSRSIQHIFNMLGCPIRKSTDQLIFANPRSLSQLITSFIASESLGIPRVPLFTFSSFDTLLLISKCLFDRFYFLLLLVVCITIALLSSLVISLFPNMSMNSLLMLYIVKSLITTINLWRITDSNR